MVTFNQVNLCGHRQPGEFAWSPSSCHLQSDEVVYSVKEKGIVSSSVAEALLKSTRGGSVNVSCACITHILVMTVFVMVVLFGAYFISGEGAEKKKKKL